MRLLNKLFEDLDFQVDVESVPYVARDIINMNWWNTCEYMLGYKKNRRVCLENPTYNMLVQAALLKEYYRNNKQLEKDVEKLELELKNYIEGGSTYLKQLKLFSMEYRKNDSQYYYKNGVSTWLDCTSRPTYSWKYVAQNGYIDFDGVCRVVDCDKIVNLSRKTSVFPDVEKPLSTLFGQGENKVKSEIFSQKTYQKTVAEWVSDLNINVLPSRVWLYDQISHVKTDPYKNNEKSLLKQGLLTGVNESLYGFSTVAILKTDDVKRASFASYTSRPSYAKHASNVSAASDTSFSCIAGDVSWYDSPMGLGELVNLDHPPVFNKHIFGLGGHRLSTDQHLLDLCELGWIDPFAGWGDSALLAKRSGKKYVGIEINPDSMNGYLLPYVQKAVDEHGDPSVKVELRLGDSSNFYPDLVNGFDLCYTSPPYFNLEDYGFHNKVIQECIDYDDYHERVTKPIFANVYKYLVDGGVLAIQTEKNKKLRDKWIDAITQLDFKLVDSTLTGQEDSKYTIYSKRDQSLLIFEK